MLSNCNEWVDGLARVKGKELRSLSDFVYPQCLFRKNSREALAILTDEKALQDCTQFWPQTQKKSTSLAQPLKQRGRM